MKENIKRILIVQLGGIGDVVMSTPVIKALRQRYKDAYIALLVISRSAPVVEGLSYIDELFVIDVKLITIRQLITIPYLFKTVRLIRMLRSKKFDLAINLKRIWSWSGAFKTAAFIHLIGAKESVGVKGKKSFFYSINVKKLGSRTKHAVEENIDVVSALGVEVKDTKLIVPISDDDREFVARFLSGNNVSDTDILVGFNPGAFRPSRRWLISRWSRLAEELIEEYNCKIIIAGARSEAKMIEKIRDAVSRKENIITNTNFTLKQYTALMERLSLFITNDTGPMHMAASTDVAIIALFGPGEVDKFYPYPKNDKHIVIRKDVNCSPCYKFGCREHICMELISTDDVMRQVRMILS